MDSVQTLEENIRAAHDGLSPSHRRLVEYLLEHDGAAFLTARQLADALGISEATVVRLAPELGYEGFPALQSELQRRLLSRVGWQPPMRRALNCLPSDPNAVLRQVLENDIESLQNTLSTVDREAFERAVSAIRSARTVYILGLRTSAAHAIYTTMRLRLIHHRTHLLLPQFGDLADQLLALTSGDVLIAISYHRYGADTVRALRHARSRSVQTIVVTDNPISPPAKAGQIVLTAHGLSSQVFHSLVAPLSLLNALVAAVTVADKSNSNLSLSRAYDTIEEFDVLLEPGSPSELDDGGTGSTPEPWPEVH